MRVLPSRNTTHKRLGELDLINACKGVFGTTYTRELFCKNSERIIAVNYLSIAHVRLGSKIDSGLIKLC